MRVSNVVILASNNRHKLEEMRSLLKKYPQLGVTLEPAKKFLSNTSKIGLVEVYNTYIENASAKARVVNQGAHYPVIADDSGLEIEHLGGKPGVRSARFATPEKGISQDCANIDKVLKELSGVPMPNRNASFKCALSLQIEGVILTGLGEVKGKILEAPQGDDGFGYDPIFMPEGHNRSFAEMSDDEKNEISHRANALKDLIAKIEEFGVVFARP